MWSDGICWLLWKSEKERRHLECCSSLALQPGETMLIMPRGGDTLGDVLGVTKGKTHLCPYCWGGREEEEIEIQTWFSLLFQFTISSPTSPITPAYRTNCACSLCKIIKAPSSWETEVLGYVANGHRAKNPIQWHLFIKPWPLTSKLFTSENGHTS